MGWVLLGILLLVVWTFAWGSWLAAPWLPMPRADVLRMLRLAQLQAGETVYDLGCGDGRLLVAAASGFQARAIGFEVALLPYLLGWCTIQLHGLRGRVRVRYQDFYRARLSDGDVVTAFLTPRAMAKLSPKLAAELPPVARVLSYAFPIPGWQPTHVDKPTPSSIAIFCYRVDSSAPASPAGALKT